ncbi:maternal effect protein oskar [Anopheles nili]|uniref:maternal effect protein oskar n=1 Tax=Anopheles nili TaxID=185578 RepID=UPI00237AB325|nr:maternal effect protein oskar [Anopheles nili]
MVLILPTTIFDTDEAELQLQLCSVIITRSKTGATIDEIIEDYLELTGEQLLDIFFSRTTLISYLLTLKRVWYSTDGRNGLVLWFCSTPKTKHVVNMIKKQRSPRGASNSYRRYMPRGVPLNNITSWQVPYGSETTYMSVKNEEYKQQTRLVETSRPKRTFRYRHPARTDRANPYTRPTSRCGMQHKQLRSNELDFSMYGPSYRRHQLLGDDFFLAIAKWELGFSFDPGHTIDMSGLCVSGLTLSEAAKRVEMAPHIADQILVNVGSVDLLHGRPMIDLIHDFDQLMVRFRERNVEPIVTTLTPIANCGGRTPMAQRLLKFNEYICRMCPRHIDLWKHFVHSDGTTRFECFQPGPRKVSGSIMPHVLWNKLGRHNLLNVLGNEIATQLTTDEQWRYY